MPKSPGRCPHCSADLTAVAIRDAFCPRCKLPHEIEADDLRDVEVANSGKNARVTVSKRDRETEIGLELLQLCQTITADGQVLDAEIVGLNEWLETNQHVDLPAVPFLSKVVGQIVADGVVTDEERIELCKAIERILPQDLRRYAVLKRREVNEAGRRVAAEERARARLAGTAAREAAEAERLQNAPVTRFNFMVAGVRYKNRAAIVDGIPYANVPVYLRRDPANKFSRNAIEVSLQTGEVVGFVPESEAVDLAPLLDDGCRSRAWIKKILEKTRAGYPIPIVEGEIYNPDSSVPEAVTQAQMPESKKSDSLGCLPGCLVVVAGFVLCVSMMTC